MSPSEHDKIIVQYLSTDLEDELLIMNHAEFTMICDKGGNHVDYGWPIQYKESILKGIYEIQIGIRYTGNEFEEHQAYYEVKLNLKKAETKGIANQVMDFGN